MNRMKRLGVVLGVAGLAFTGACARGVAVQSESGVAYTLEVTNAASSNLIVSYDDGSGPRLLGTVPANQQQRFIITSPSRTHITVTATDEAGSMNLRREVTLVRGSVAEVRLSP
jgi:hypothetical protein